MKIKDLIENLSAIENKEATVVIYGDSAELITVSFATQIIREDHFIIKDMENKRIIYSNEIFFIS